MFSGFGLTELLVILAIVLLIFGPKRLKNLGSDLGSAIKGFRTAVTDEETEEPAAAAGEEKIIEGQVNSGSSANSASDSASGAQSKTKQNTNV